MRHIHKKKKTTKKNQKKDLDYPRIYCKEMLSLFVKTMGAWIKISKLPQYITNNLKIYSSDK